MLSNQEKLMEEAKALRAKALDYLDRTGLGDGSKIPLGSEQYEEIENVMMDVWKAENKANYWC